MDGSAKKIRNQGEMSYIYATLLMAFGTVLCIKANLGMSMVAAPAYCISQWIGNLMGFGEYIFQGALLAVLCLVVRKFKWQYLLSFFTAFLFGTFVNLFQMLLEDWTVDSLVLRIVLFAVGCAIVSLSVAFYFNTYLPLAVYELFVAEISDTYRFPVGKTKTVYDYSSLFLSILLSLLVFGVFGDGDMTSFIGITDTLQKGGVYIGTFFVTIFNSMMISGFDKLLKKYFSFEPKFPKLYAFIKR